MLPISEVMFAKTYKNDSEESNSEEAIDWILYDVYKVAPRFPLQVSIYGYLFNEAAALPWNNPEPISSEPQRIRITDKFLSKSARDDLQGLQIRCGYGVCIQLNLSKI